MYTTGQLYKDMALCRTAYKYETVIEDVIAGEVPEEVGFVVTVDGAQVEIMQEATAYNRALKAGDAVQVTRMVVNGKDFYDINKAEALNFVNTINPDPREKIIDQAAWLTRVHKIFIPDEYDANFKMPREYAYVVDGEGGSDCITIVAREDKKTEIFMEDQIALVTKAVIDGEDVYRIHVVDEF